jgi:hypothetical protein
MEIVAGEMACYTLVTFIENGIALEVKPAGQDTKGPAHLEAFGALRNLHNQFDSTTKSDAPYRACRKKTVQPHPVNSSGGRFLCAEIAPPVSSLQFYILSKNAPMI